MDFALEVLVLKDDINKVGLSELLVGWGGELFSQDPPKYQNNKKLIFEQILDLEYYKRFMNSNVNIYDYVALRLIGNQLSELERLINYHNREEHFLNINEIFLFLKEVSKLNYFVLFLIRDEENIDNIYQISNAEELIHLVYKSIKLSTAEGVLVTK